MVKFQDNPTSSPKPNFGVINVMTTDATTLEEQVASLTKTVESFTSSFKEMDDQMTFMVKRALGLTGKKPNNEEVQHENLQKEAGEQSNVQVAKNP